MKPSYLSPKGSLVVYTAPRGGEYYADVIRAHKDGTRTIRVCWAIRGRELLGGYFGDRYRVPAEMLAPRTAAGVNVCNLRHESLTRKEA
jgi:hypothetical protein